MPNRVRVVGGMWQRMPLRVKLVAILLLLVLAALVGSGAVAAVTLRGYLVGRVDAQLSDAQHPIAEHPGQSGPDDGDDRNRLPSAYVTEITGPTGAVVSGPTSNLVNSEPLPNLPTFTGAQTAQAGSRFLTVDAVSGGGQWRVLAAPIMLPGGSTGTLLIAQSLGDVARTVDRLVTLLVVIDAVTVVVLAGVGYLIVRASLRPLREVESTAAAIAAGDLTRRVPATDARTEVGQLAAALNRMLGEIETAFAERERSETAARRSEDRMRRFVADASHELRTPLTSIRGFAELYRQGAAGGAGDVPRLMRRIEDEAKRMGLLVEDLLMLARLDQQRPLAQEPVDMLALAADAVHDAQAVDRTRPITLEVGQTDPPPIVTGDEPRLRQVLGNLVGNALRHTPDQAPVSVRVSTRDGTRPAVLVAVTDRGPGMSEQDAARVFERFYRTDSSRNRNDGGTGLGLAIVSALVAAHGGRVQVQTAPGSGSCFEVELPLAGVSAASS